MAKTSEGIGLGSVEIHQLILIYRLTQLSGLSLVRRKQTTICTLNTISTLDPRINSTYVTVIWFGPPIRI